MSLELIHSNLLNKYKSLCHFTTTTDGGVSEGNYASFNLGLYSGDSLGNVLENRSRLALAIGLPPENLFFSYQTHEDKVYVIDEEFLRYSKVKQDELLSGIDSLITNTPSVCIGVTTADCVPILLFDPKRNVFAAVHAGWRGTVANIIGRTVDEMKSRFGATLNDIIAYIGPCISKDAFEVGDDVVLAFENAGFDILCIGDVSESSKKMHIDLVFSNQILLLKSGILIGNIECSNICTYKSGLSMFSARRQTIKSGRMITGGFLRW